jgi:hypothetical protein
MNMRRKVEIMWPDFNTRVFVELFEEENPEVCNRLLESLPIQTYFIASMSAGEMLKAPIPFVFPPVPEKNLAFVPSESSGMVFGMSNSLVIKYGIVVEPFRLPRIGKIREEELEKLKSCAIRLRDAFFFTKDLNKAILKV